MFWGALVVGALKSSQKTYQPGIVFPSEAWKKMLNEKHPEKPLPFCPRKKKKKKNAADGPVVGESPPPRGPSSPRNHRGPRPPQTGELGQKKMPPGTRGFIAAMGLGFFPFTKTVGFRVPGIFDLEKSNSGGLLGPSEASPSEWWFWFAWLAFFSELSVVGFWWILQGTYLDPPKGAFWRFFNI